VLVEILILIFVTIHYLFIIAISFATELKFLIQIIAEIIPKNSLSSY
jgi:hypothetical protein